MLEQAATICWDLLWKLWYPLVTRLSRKSSVIFLNYGYDGSAEGEVAPPLDATDEADHPCIQLYHRVVSTVDVAGLDVLEVSCGHGGGASYIARYLHPKSMRGVDRNRKAIELCRQRHQVEGLTFFHGNAQSLRFDDATFDVVVNVEASHCYPDVLQFFLEVNRVLRPGGHFLYADFRQSGRALTILRKQLEASGLESVQYADISPQVIRGMQLNTPKYKTLIQNLVPSPLQKPAMTFAGVEGSTIYNSLASGETAYICCHLRKHSLAKD